MSFPIFFPLRYASKYPNPLTYRFSLCTDDSTEKEERNTGAISEISFRSPSTPSILPFLTRYRIVPLAYVLRLPKPSPNNRYPSKSTPTEHTRHSSHPRKSNHSPIRRQRRSRFFQEKKRQLHAVMISPSRFLRQKNEKRSVFRSTQQAPIAPRTLRSVILITQNTPTFCFTAQLYKTFFSV